MVKLDLLAQDDSSGWMNILFIVVVAVFWAVGGLIKATGNRNQKQGAQKPSQPSSDGRKRETWLQQLAKKAEEIQRAMEMGGSKEQPRPPRQPQERPVESSRPSEGRVAVRTGRGGRPVLVYERQGPQRPAEEPRQQPATQAESQVAAERTSMSAAKKTIPADHVSSLVIDYTDPDAMKKAILHYEILGKPMALRDPFERISAS